MPSVDGHDSSLTKSHALSSCVGEAHGLRNPIFLSVAAQTTDTRRADAKYGKRDALSRDMHAGEMLSLSQRTRVITAHGETTKLKSLLFRYGEHERDVLVDAN